MMLMNRSFQHDVLWAEEPAASVEPDGALSGDSLPGPEASDVPQIAAYAAPSPTDASAGTAGMEKAVPNPAADGAAEYEIVPQADAVLILDRLPDGAADIIPSETAVSHDIETGTDIYRWLTAEELAAIEALAFEQGMIPGTTEAAPAPERCALIVRNK